MYNIMNHTKEILSFKNQLLFPKRSDKFTIQYYLEGWRTCEVTIGRKKDRDGSMIMLDIESLLLYNLIFNL